MSNELPKSEREKTPKVKIAIPVGWGAGVVPPIMQMKAKETSEGYNLIDKRIKVERKMRELMGDLGLIVEEQDALQTENIDEHGETFQIQGKLSRDSEIELVREAVPEIQIPKSLTVDEFEKSPFYPVVAYYEYSAGGFRKYLIEDELQWSTFNAFLKNDGKFVRDSFSMREFIYTPSQQYTSYRVVTSALGSIMASGLLYSGGAKESPEYISSGSDPANLGRAGFNVLDYLEVEDSPYYLRAKKFTSNITGGGGCIPLNPTQESRPETAQEEEILHEHGIRNSELPPIIAEQASKIGKLLGPKLGLAVGIDFIQDRNGNYYYLETNGEPGVDVYLAGRNNGKGDDEAGYRMMMTEAIKELAE